MLIKDLVVLGRACPEPLSDGRVTVCMAGWSDTKGFMRLYPTRKDMSFHQWDIIEVDVEQNAKDTRLESWKITGAKSEWDNLASKVKVVSHMSSVETRRNLIGNLTDSCVNVVNEAKRSLGIIKPSILRTHFQDNKSYGQLFQQAMPGFTELDDAMVKRDFPKEPRITYRCPDCQTASKQHDQQVLEWGFYEWMRKNPDNIDQVWKNADIGEADRDHYFLVGNQAAHRNSFMIISVLRFPKGDIVSPMFPHRKIPDD